MEKETALELIRFAPYILGTKNGYRAKKMLEQVAPVIYSNKTLPRSMSPENFQRNIVNMYKKFYGKEWDMDYKSFCFAMRIPLNIATRWMPCIEKQHRIENMEKGDHYILYLQLGECQFSIVGTLDGFLTDSERTKYWELSEEEKGDVLIALSNRSLGTVLIPVRMLQEYVAIDADEIYEAGMFLLKHNPRLLYEHQNHYCPDSTLPVCKERISVVDYIERLYDDVEDELIIDTETVFELYKNRFSKEILDLYIENCQKQYDIVKDILYLNKYDMNRNEEKASPSFQETDASIQDAEHSEDDTANAFKATSADTQLTDVKQASYPTPHQKFYGIKRGTRRAVSYHKRKSHSSSQKF